MIPFNVARKCSQESSDLHTAMFIHMYLICFFLYFAGLRVIYLDGYSSDATSRVRNGTRVHFRDAEASADDHIGFWEEVNTDVSELSRPADNQRAADGGHRLRGDRADV